MTRTAHTFHRTVAWSILATFALSSLGHRTWAAKRPTVANEHFRQGQLFFKTGRFEQAIDEFTKAYAEERLPVYAFDIAQCYFQLKNYERAIFFYQSYYGDETDTSRRKLAADMIEKTKALRATQIADEKLVPRLIAPAPATQPASMILVAPEEKAIVKKWWFWTALAGVVAVAAGVTTAVLLTRSPSNSASLQPVQVGK